MRYNTVLFDIDNTLINTDDQHKAALKYVYEEFHHYFKELTFKDFYTLYDKSKSLNKANLGLTGASFSRTHDFYYILNLLGVPSSSEIALKMANTYWDFVIKRADIYRFTTILYPTPLKTASIITDSIVGDPPVYANYSIKEGKLIDLFNDLSRS